MEIREVNSGEMKAAMALARRVFQTYEAPEYKREGIETFQKCLEDSDFLQRLRVYGAFTDGKIVGMLATRNGGDHIALFFVDGAYHRRGIGRRLFFMAKSHNTSGKITVNSSPYAVEVYRHLGFTATGTEQLTDGIRYTPMVFHVNEKMKTHFS